MRRKLKGTLTIEAAIIVPLFLLVFGVALNCLFYYHDKNVIGAAAYETVAEGSGREGYDEGYLENYFRKRVEGRTFLFPKVDGKVEISDLEVEITCSAKKNAMRIVVERSMSLTDPEDFIRSIRKIGKVQDKIGDTE